MNSVKSIFKNISGFIALMKAGNGFLRSIRCKVPGLIKNGACIYANKVYITGRVKLGDNCKLYHCDISGDVKVGRFSSVYGPGVAILSKINPIKIGSFCSIARNVQILEYNHFTNKPSTYYINQNIFNACVKNDITSSGPIVIGHDVWIGSNSIILSGVRIGNGAVIAAGSVVTKDVPEFSIVGGNPARVIKSRFSELAITEINNDPWWEKDISVIRKKSEYFNSFLN